jgi:hypothetical protein
LKLSKTKEKEKREKRNQSLHCSLATMEAAVHWEEEDSLRRSTSMEESSFQRRKKTVAMNTTHRNWNEEFQVLVEKYRDLWSDNEESTDLNAAEARLRELKSFYESFVRISRKFAKVIIEESSLPPDQRIISPANVGGVAGGTKFIWDGIFFKVRTLFFSFLFSFFFF